jgi:hypothetical protein
MAKGSQLVSRVEMKRSLTNQYERVALVARLKRLTPESPRQWGRMTPHQAICHLSDSFRGLMGVTSVGSFSTILSRTLVKWIALRLPLKWPPGIKTPPEVDQEIGGTKPVEFGRDRRELEALMERFAQSKSQGLQPHPFFGRLSDEEWQRWAYLHMDHHLRQFGV